MVCVSERAWTGSRPSPCRLPSVGMSSSGVGVVAAPARPMVQHGNALSRPPLPAPPHTAPWGSVASALPWGFPE